MKHTNKKLQISLLTRYALIASVSILTLFGSCTIILSESTSGTTAADSGVLGPILTILEQDLLSSYEATPSLTLVSGNSSEIEGPSRTITGGANSIKHGLPSATVTTMKQFIRQRVRDEGLEKSRDLNKVCPAVARATAAALVDESISAALEDSDLVDIHAIATRAITKAVHAPSVGALAEGLGTIAEKTAQIQAISTTVAASLSDFALQHEQHRDAVQKLALVISDAGNSDLSTTDSEALTERALEVASNLGSTLDNSSLYTSTNCAEALNDMVNATMIGLASGPAADLAETDLQEVVRDGVLYGMFSAYYEFRNISGLSAQDLIDEVDFVSAMDILGSGDYYDAVAAHIQAQRASIVPAAEQAVRRSLILNSGDVPADSLLAAAVTASTVPINTTTTWTAGSVIYIASSLTINGTLNIQEGVTILINASASMTISSTGNLQAQGTLANPIQFTRAYSNRWNTINIASGGNNLSYCDIQGGTTGLTLTGRATVSNCHIHDNSSLGIDASAAASDISNLTSINNSYFYNNGSFPLSVNQNVVLGTDNHFWNPNTQTAPDMTQANNAIVFAGNISKAITLSAQEVPWYRDGNLTVTAGALTIEPGTIIKATVGSSIRIDSGALLYANGTTDDRIVFSSYSDSTVGGRTNGLTAAATPGDWYGIDLMSSGNQISYCDITYGQIGVGFNMYSNQQGSGSISNCRISNTSSHGLHAEKANTGSSAASNQIWNCGNYPAKINQYLSFAADNLFYNSQTTSTPDLTRDKNAILYYGNIAQAVSLYDCGIPYVIDATLNVQSDTLTLAPGVIIKTTATSWIRVYNTARIIANGSADKRIAFTSYTDSSVGGRTNGLTLPANPGDWYGIDIAGVGNEFAYCDFSFAQNGLIINYWISSGNGNGNISNCRFFKNSHHGINGERSSSALSVNSSQFYENGSYPLHISEYVIIAADNLFYNPLTQEEPNLEAAYNAISFYGNIKTPVQWLITDIPWVVDGTLIVYEAPGSLNIAPGAMLKFHTDSGIQVNQGGLLVAEGTAEAPIHFTSISDNTVGGNTSGVPSAVANPGDWNRVDMLSKANRLAYCVFTYASTPITFNIWSNLEGYASVSNCTLTNNLTGGINATRADLGTSITNCSLSNNNATASGPYDINIGTNSANVVVSGCTYEFIN